MKKTLQKTLAIVMVIAMIFSQIAIMSSAVEPEIVNITVEAQRELIEEYDGCWTADYVEEEGTYTDSYFAYEPEYAWLYYIVTFADGTSITGERYEMESYIEIIDFETDQSYDNPWGLGAHTATALILMGNNEFRCDFEIYVVENPIESVSAVATEPIIQNHEGFSGRWDYDYNWDTNEFDLEYFHYKVDWYEYVYTIKYKDGRVLEGTMDDIYELVDRWDYEFETNQSYEEQWGVGKQTFKIFFLGVEGVAEIEIVETPVESVSVVSAKKLIENYSGMISSDYVYNEEKDEYEFYDFFEYSIINADPICTVTYKDGRTFTGNHDEIESQTGFYIQFEDNQGYNNQWELGENEFVASVAGVKCSGKIEIVESPFESISGVAQKTLVENADGFWSNAYNPETDEYDGPKYFYYDIAATDPILTVTFKDGRVIEGDAEYVVSEIDKEYVVFFDSEDYQDYENQWGIGKHIVELILVDVIGYIEVEVVENPIESVTAIAQHDLIEFTDGYWTTDWDYENGCETEEYFTYDLDCASFIYTVTYKDGQVFVGNASQIHEQTGYNVENFNNQSYYNQWDIGEHEITVDFHGVEGTVLINVIESPIDYIIVNDITLIENFNGRWDYDYSYWDEDLGEWVRVNEYFRYSIHPSYTAVMKDGTEYESDTYGSIFYNDRWIDMSYKDNQSFENQWSLGTYEVTGTLMGKEVTYNVTIVDTTIESMTLTPIRDLIIGIDDVNYQEYLDFIAEIKLKDGTTKECLVSDLQYEYDCWIFSGEDYYVKENVRGGKFNFLGYEGEYTVKFIENPYESISISGTNELIITLHKLDGTTETAKVLDTDWRAGGSGEALGYLITDIGTFPGGISYAFDETTEKEYINKDITIYIGDMESNTLETNNWYWAFSTSKSLYGSISFYQRDDNQGSEFVFVDITNSNYNINDIINISIYNKSWKYDNDYYYEIVDGEYYYYMVFNADDVQEMVENTFNISDFDVTMYKGYNSDDHTIKVLDWGGFGDWGYVYYTLEYKDGKWYGTEESHAYNEEPKFINIVLNDEMLIEKISFGKEEEIVTLNGWVNENGKWAFYENGVKATNKWLQDSQGWCFVDDDGYCVTNDWKADSQGWCYLDDNGRMVINKWVLDVGKWYFMDENGYMVSNQWRKDSKGWCYLSSSGAMSTNAWVKDSVGWCYVGADGYCIVNQWVKDSVGWCYLDANGRMVTNRWIADSKGWCYVGSNGYMVTNKWVKDSKGWCYVGADGYCVTNTWKADSKGWCYLDANGRMVISNWVQDGGKWYYLDENGYMVTGTKVIGGKTYKFASNGVWIA